MARKLHLVFARRRGARARKYRPFVLYGFERIRNGAIVSSKINGFSLMTLTGIRALYRRLKRTTFNGGECRLRRYVRRKFHFVLLIFGEIYTYENTRNTISATRAPVRSSIAIYLSSFYCFPNVAGFYLPYVWLELVGLPAMPESTENKSHPRLRIHDVYSGALITLQDSHFQAGEWLQRKLNS